MRLLNKTDINFMGVRKTGFGLSILLILASVVFLVVQGGPKYGIDFEGGTLLEYRFVDKNDKDAIIKVPVDKVREVFSANGYEGASVRYFGSDQDIAAQVNLGDITKEIDAELSSLVQKLEAAMPEYSVSERRRESVGPKIGNELIWSALKSILIAMGLILVYIMFRFEFRFGIGAVLALFHDITITLGFFTLIGIEVTVPVIAALLTIIGYSLNDTIVVYDRIRENLNTFKQKAGNYGKIINKSVNETLSRTIVTSGTTLIVVLVLYFVGSEVIKDFAVALVCGVIIGTYSSIFIASPILLEWEERFAKKTTSATNKEIKATRKKKGVSA